MRGRRVFVLLLAAIMAVLCAATLGETIGGVTDEGQAYLEANLSATLYEEYMKSIERQDEWVCTCPVSCKEMGYEVENYQPNTCKISYMKPGTENEHTAAKVLTWFCFIASFACFVWFAYQYYYATCGWEVLWVAFIESIYYIVDVFFAESVPFKIYVADGQSVVLLRYTEWLLTCPVLLIHLSNVTGLNEEYNERTMVLLTSDQGTIMFGILAAFSRGGLKIFFFCVGALFGINTFYNAAQVYIEAYYIVPQGICQRGVKFLTWAYFLSWPLFPVMFVFGPTGFGHLDRYGDLIAHAIIDFISKNIWGMFAWYLRYLVHTHVVMNGHHTKRVKTVILGQERELTVLADENDKEAVTHSTRALTTRRRSIERLARQLKSKGIKTRTSLDLEDDRAGGNLEAGWKSKIRGSLRGKGSARGNPMGDLPATALVVVATADEELGNFFVKELNKLRSQIQVEIIRSDEEAVQCLDYFRQNGPKVDMVLVQPTLAQQYPNLVTTIRNYGVASVAFSSSADQRAMLGTDDFITGPSFGTPFDSAVLGSMLVKHRRK